MHRKECLLNGFVEEEKKSVDFLKKINVSYEAIFHSR